MVDPPIVLLTDFGTRDHFVSAMKGVILSINSDATIVDVTHEVPKFDVWTGGFLLYNAAQFFPSGSIFVAVVDPEVGKRRKIVLLRTRDGKYFIAPDNGILTFIFKMIGAEWVREVKNRKLMMDEISPSFHGRDIMAPVAAHLSRGAKPEIVGPLLKRIRLLPVRKPERSGRSIRGQVWHVDDFGNLITNIDMNFVGGIRGGKINVCLPEKEFTAVLGKTFGDVRRGEIVAYMGSSGLLEIAKNRGNLALEARVKTGQEIIIRW